MKTAAIPTHKILCFCCYYMICEIILIAVPDKRLQKSEAANGYHFKDSLNAA